MSPSPFDNDMTNSLKEQSRKSGTTGLPRQHALGSAERRGWMGAAYMPTALHSLRRQPHEVSVSAVALLGQKSKQPEALTFL